MRQNRDYSLIWSDMIRKLRIYTEIERMRQNDERQKREAQAVLARYLPKAGE